MRNYVLWVAGLLILIAFLQGRKATEPNFSNAPTLRLQ